MTPTLHTLENDFWQVGILPETGASVAFGRVRKDDAWVDVLRPTDPADYDNASKCASFILIPWSNRIRDAKFTFEGTEYPLEVNNSEGTASHGDTRKRPWQVESAGRERINLSFNSTAHNNLNFPFPFAATAEYWLDGHDFLMCLSLRNIGDQPMPGGMGHHPYFVRTDDVMLELPLDEAYEMVDSLPTGAAVPIPEHLDFRTLRKLSDAPPLNDLLRGRQSEKPMRIVYPDLSIGITADSLYEHVVVYSPEGQPHFAVEPVTNANDGFNLYARGIPGSGVFVLAPGEEKDGMIRVKYEVN